MGIVVIIVVVLVVIMIVVVVIIIILIRNVKWNDVGILIKLHSFLEKNG